MVRGSCTVLTISVLGSLPPPPPHASGTHSTCNGVGCQTQPGKEWISVTGALSVDLAMKAFAFEAGTATVNYTYSR